MRIEVKLEELRKKKLFVATPMYGGQCAGMFAKACIDLATLCTNYGVDCRFFFIFNESLITRARNYLADEFIRAEEFTHLMFIDSDIHFDPRDVLSLLALCDDDHPIIGGPYGKKCIAWEKVRQAVEAGIADEDPKELSKFVGDFVFNPVEGTRELHINEPVEVLETGTGFMVIQRNVFNSFKEAYPRFHYKPDHNRSEHFDGSRYIHAYFDTVIDNDKYMPGGESGNSDRYLSEDYMFCQLSRRLGHKIYLCPWMRLGHVGTYVFDGSLAEFGRIDGANPIARENLIESKRVRDNRILRKQNHQAVKEVEDIQKKATNRAERRKALKNKKK